VPLIAVRRSASENLVRQSGDPDNRLPAPGRRPGPTRQRCHAGTLELHSAYDNDTVAVAGQEVPLEKDTSITTAYKLAEEEIWSFGIDAFLGRLQDVPSRLYRFQPYEPDRIPVIFVHGTMSSPVWWAEMINTLSGDPVLGRRYQFWYFFYNSSRLITVSALDLRRAIAANIARFDPGRNSAAMQRMVVIGHSQGGLLAKLTAVDTGDRLVAATIAGKIEDLRTSNETRR